MFGGVYAEATRVDGSRPGFHPVALALKGVGGQADAARTGAVEHGHPVGCPAVDVRLGSRQQEPPHTAFAAPERAEHAVAVAVILYRFLHTGYQYRVRTRLDERAVALFTRPSDRLLEQHRLPQIGEPVVAVEDVGVESGTGD